MSIKTYCNLKNYLFVLFSLTAEFVNCSLFLKNLEKTFLQFALQKKTLSSTLKIYRNIYRKNSSITDIALRN